MKILYYSPHPGLNLQSLGGYARHMREMIAAFREMGHEVLPVIMGGVESTSSSPGSSTEKRSLRQRLKPFIPPVVWGTVKDRSLLKFDKYAKETLKEHVTKFKPDLIYERANYMQLSGVETAQEAGIPHILEMNSPYVDEKVELESPTWMRGRARRAEGRQLDLSTVTITVSSPLRDYLLKHHPTVAPEKVRVLPNAINPVQVQAPEDARETLRKRFGFEDGHTVAGFVGSIFPWHGVDLLISAFEKLEKDYPDLRLLIVGDGEVKPTLEAQAAAAGLSEKVIFAGRVAPTEIYAHIAAMDICVAANCPFYSSPLKVFEYGAMGLPVIAPDKGSVRDFMDDGVHGLLTPPEAGKLSEKLRFMLDHPEERTEMAACFHNKVMTEHTWMQNAKHSLELAGLA